VFLPISLIVGSIHFNIKTKSTLLKLVNEHSLCRTRKMPRKRIIFERSTGGRRRCRAFSGEIVLTFLRRTVPNADDDPCAIHRDERRGHNRPKG
jgi:hypothetical protein